MAEIGDAVDAGLKPGAGQAVRGKVMQHHRHVQIDTAGGQRSALVKDGRYSARYRPRRVMDRDDDFDALGHGLQTPERGYLGSPAITLLGAKRNSGFRPRRPGNVPRCPKHGGWEDTRSPGTAIQRLRFCGAEHGPGGRPGRQEMGLHAAGAGAPHDGRARQPGPGPGTLCSVRCPAGGKAVDGGCCPRPLRHQRAVAPGTGDAEAPLRPHAARYRHPQTVGRPPLPR